MADDLGRLFDGLGGIRLARLFAGVQHGPLDHRDRVIHVEGFGQIVEGAALVGTDGALEIGVGGHDDDRQGRVLLVYLAQQVDAVDPGHPDVADDRVGLFAVQAGKQSVAGFETDRVDTLLLQRPLQHPADGSVVVHHPDSCVAPLHGVAP